MQTFEETIEELRKIPWFRELSEKHLQDVTAITHLRIVKAGEVLFREGDKADFVYIILKGRIGLNIFIPHRGKVQLYTADPQEVFGWSSVTPTVHQRTAGATVVLDGLVACIDAEKLREVCEADHDLGYLVMRRLANVVTSRLLVTRLQLIDMFAGPEEASHA